MDIAVSAQDEKAIEVLALGLPLHHGAQLAVDVHSPVRPDRERRSSPQRCSGGRRSLGKYTELLAGDRCRLVVVAFETGGRWSNEAIQFTDDLAAPDQGRHHQSCEGQLS